LDAIDDLSLMLALEVLVGMKKSKSKERIFSVRDDFGQWDEKNQRPELFDILNGKIENGQNVCFPISNWTELDVWSYIEENKSKSHFFHINVRYS
jgi:3'-phosphoadenosine 5'-phosphosulfate sulfotransferase (PAPS reductase)/FAD synthetase